MRQHHQRMRALARRRGVEAVDLAAVARGECDRLHARHSGGRQPRTGIHELLHLLRGALIDVDRPGIAIGPGAEHHLVVVPADATEGHHHPREGLHQAGMQLRPFGLRLDVLDGRLVGEREHRERRAVAPLQHEPGHRDVVAPGQLGAGTRREIDAIRLRRFAGIGHQRVDDVVVRVELGAIDQPAGDRFRQWGPGRSLRGPVVQDRLVLVVPGRAETPLAGAIELEMGAPVDALDLRARAGARVDLEDHRVRIFAAIPAGEVDQCHAGFGVEYLGDDRPAGVLALAAQVAAVGDVAEQGVLVLAIDVRRHQFAIARRGFLQRLQACRRYHHAVVRGPDDVRDVLLAAETQHLGVAAAVELDDLQLGLQAVLDRHFQRRVFARGR